MLCCISGGLLELSEALQEYAWSPHLYSSSSSVVLLPERLEHACRDAATPIPKRDTLPMAAPIITAVIIPLISEVVAVGLGVVT